MELNPANVSKLLSDPDTCATVLHILVLSIYGNEVYDIDPLEMYIELEDRFNARLPVELENKLNAILLAVSTEVFYDDLEGFIAICDSLYDGDIADIVDNTFDRITLPEMLWATYEVALNRGDDQEFAPAIERHIQRVADDEHEDIGEIPMDVIETPEKLPYFQMFVSDMLEDMKNQFALLGLSGPEVEAFFNQ